MFDLGNLNLKKFFDFDYGKVKKIYRKSSFLFRCVYNFCTRANVEETTNRPINARRGANAPGGAEFIGSDLYERLKKFISDFVGELLVVSCWVFYFII